MNSLYIDESGSMTSAHSAQCPYFVVAVLYPYDPKSVKRVYKRYVSSRMNRLRQLDTRSKMFRPDGSFHELKGSCFDLEMKKDFIKYFCQNKLFTLYFIKISNRYVKPHFFYNTAKAFNYVIKLAFNFWIQRGYLSNHGYNIQLDERNESPDTKHFLEDYLNTELYFDEISKELHTVKYFDSANNACIQIADVFANIYYSELMCGNFTKEIKWLRENGYISHEFIFPYRR